MKLSINLSIDLGNVNEAMFYGLLMKEVGKYNIPIALGQPTETTAKAVVAPKQSKPTTTAKAVAPKPTTSSSKKSGYTPAHDYTFALSLDSQGYVTLSTNDGHSSGAWALASKTLLENNFTRPEGDKAHYMIVGKGGKISKKLTKEAYDGYENHQILISGKAIDNYNAEKYGRA